MKKNNIPSAETIQRIAGCIPTPFHLYDEAILIARARALNEAFSWNEGFREYFAVKATPNPYILEVLKREGCGVDCSSLTELQLAHAVGFRGDEIMFSSNETPAEDYEFARALDVIINLDDISHIDFLKNHGGIPKRICLRYNPGGDAVIGNYVMGRPSEAKYGMTRDQIFEATKRLMALGVKSFGLHAFLVSNATDNAYYPTLSRILMQLALDVNEETGARFDMINLSGGVGIPYHPDEKEVDIANVGEGVRLAYDELIAGSKLESLSIAAELGRYIAGPAGCLVTRAVHRKDTHKQYIGVDATACDLMRPAMYNAYHHITVLGKENAPCDKIYDVVGSLCENNDKFAIDRELPAIEGGDLLVLHDTGAHGRSMGYNYNGKLRSAEVLLRQNGKFELIRRAETPADYFATLSYPGL